MQHFVLEVCIGHRGLAAHAPENTLASIRAAAKAGLSWVEFDVRLSADNVAVLSHDADLWRCCGRRERVLSKTATQLAAIPANRTFANNKKFHNEGIPSLSDAVQTVMAHNLGAVIEIKPARTRETQTLQSVASALPPNFRQVIISSFSMPMLLAAKKALPHIPRAYNCNRPNSKCLECIKQVAAANIHCGAQTNAKTLRQFAAAGYGVYCFTVDSASSAKALLAAGAHGVFSNTNLLPKLKNRD